MPRIRSKYTALANETTHWSSARIDNVMTRAPSAEPFPPGLPRTASANTRDIDELTMPMTERIAVANATNAMGAAMPRKRSFMKATVEVGEPAGSNLSLGCMMSAMPVNAWSNSSLDTFT